MADPENPAGSETGNASGHAPATPVSQNQMEEFLKLMTSSIMNMQKGKNVESGNTETFGEGLSGSWQDKMKQFHKSNPPQFYGKGSPDEADEWLDGIEQVLQYVMCTESEKVKLTEFVLKGVARDWWRTTKLSLADGGSEITWEMFRKAFLKKFFSNTARNKKMQEFLSLKQGSLSVDEYESKFTTLSKYAPRIVEDQEDRARRFEEGLRYDIQKQVVPFQLATYDAVYDRAQVVEQLIANEPRRFPVQQQQQSSFQAGNRGKRPFVPQQQYSPNKKKFQGTSGSTQQRMNCDTCGGNHTTEKCYRNVGACFRCGKKTHLIKDCPEMIGASGTQSTQQTRNVPPFQQRPPAQVRVFALSEEDALGNETMMTGTILVCGVPAIALFDTGATH